MAQSVIVFQTSPGAVQLLVPSAEALTTFTLEQIAAKDLPPGVEWIAIDALPSEPIEAWSLVDGELVSDPTYTPPPTKDFGLFRDTMNQNTGWLALLDSQGSIPGMLARYVADGDAINAGRMYAYLDSQGRISPTLKQAIAAAAVAANLQDEFAIVAGS